MLERFLTEGDAETKERAVIGFIEDVQNASPWRAFGANAFLPFLGRSRADVAWKIQFGRRDSRGTAGRQIVMATAEIRWLRVGEGGRLQPPGPRYSTVARFEEQTEEQWKKEAWSLVVELHGWPDESGHQVAAIRFLSGNRTGAVKSRRNTRAELTVKRRTRSFQRFPTQNRLAN
jgi:hypothetical protein